VLIGSMNPEEGDLRPQLLDRFGLCVDILSIKDPVARVRILERNLAFEGDSAQFMKTWEPSEAELTLEIAEARERLPNVQHSGRDLATIANLMAQMGVDGHRADLVILRAARAHAAFQKRESITENDILLAAELALPHRLKRHPFQDTEQAMSVLSDKLQQIESQMEQQQAQDQQSQQGKQQDASKKVKRG
jgi:Mg-chelatase subunit ChlI